MFKMPAARVTWLTAFFLLGYVGAEVALGGWIVLFMINVRKGAEFASGMTATGFWLGITVGRVVLGFVTPRIGEKLAIAVSTKPVIVNDLIANDIPDLPSYCDRSRTSVLARTTILRLSGRCGSRGILHRTIVPCCHGRVHEASSETPPCVGHWICRSVWW